MTANRPRYADTSLCPDCRAPLPATPFRCPACSLPLQGFLAAQLLTTLSEADDLLERLRASAVIPPFPRPAPPAPPPAPATPVTAPPRGMSGASVPKVLLGLGATCLLVAAVIFLAVAWSWLGVGGRTAVLVGLTATSGAVGILLARRGLTVAAEALVTVALGLVVLDVLGADRAGWLGELSDQGLARAVGVALLVPALVLCGSPRRLVAPQLVAAGATALVLGSVDWPAYAVSAVDTVGPVSVLALAGLCALGRRFGAEVLAWTSGLMAAASWMGCGLWSFAEASQHPTTRELWVDGHGWELVLMSLLTLLSWGVAWNDSLLRQGAAAVVAGTVTWALVLPGLDGTATRLTLVAMAVTLVWALVATVTPPAWAMVPRVPLVAGVVAVTAAGLALATAAAVGVATVGPPLGSSFSVRVVPLDQPLHPLLLIASTATLGVAGLLTLPRTRRTLLVTGGAVAAAAFVTLGLYPVPLWLVLAGLALAAGGLLGRALRRHDTTAALVAGAAGVLALAVVVGSLPSPVLLVAALGATVTALVVTLRVGRFPRAAEAAGLGLPATSAALIWSVAELLEVDPAHRALPSLVAVGLLAVVRPRAGVEASAAVSGLLAATAAVPYADDLGVSLAVHLTLAGALVTLSSVLNPSRRLLAWPGGVLLAGATWVRLADLGVEAPEAYTLPSAVVLVLAGLHRLHVASDATTAPTLGPGLWLATVPSLLWVLDDPVTTRAGLLGAGCLLLLLAGAQLRWHAPVLVGAVVGGLVVLRELTPYALQTPQWVLIGTAGTLLVVCGITWEGRMRDLQHAAAYLGRLR